MALAAECMKQSSAFTFFHVAVSMEKGVFLRFASSGTLNRDVVSAAFSACLAEVGNACRHCLQAVGSSLTVQRLHSTRDVPRVAVRPTKRSSASIPQLSRRLKSAIEKKHEVARASKLLYGAVFAIHDHHGRSVKKDDKYECSASWNQFSLCSAGEHETPGAEGQLIHAGDILLAALKQMTVQKDIRESGHVRPVPVHMLPGIATPITIDEWRHSLQRTTASCHYR